MTDTETIIRFLKSVQSRIRANLFIHELTVALTGFFAFPILLKIWNIFSPLPTFVITGSVSLWILAVAGYTLRRVLQKRTLAEAARSIDAKANLNDEIKTALWFIDNPRSSEWLDTQIRRAAQTAHSVQLNRLYPLTVPRSSYTAAAMILIFLALHFVPPRSNVPAPQVAQSSTSMPRVEDTLQQLRGTPIDSSAATALLEELEKELSGSQPEKPDLQSELSPEALADDAVGSVTNPFGQFRDGSGEEEDPQIMMGPPSKLQVQLEKEKLESTPDETIKPEDLEPSKWVASKLSYRAVRSAIVQGERELLSKQGVPWEYRPLIKEYFQPTRRPVKK
jgi:hypothetical protein